MSQYTSSNGPSSVPQPVYGTPDGSQAPTAGGDQSADRGLMGTLASHLIGSAAGAHKPQYNQQGYGGGGFPNNAGYAQQQQPTMGMGQPNMAPNMVPPHAQGQGYGYGAPPANNMASYGQPGPYGGGAYGGGGGAGGMGMGMGMGMAPYGHNGGGALSHPSGAVAAGGAGAVLAMIMSNPQLKHALIQMVLSRMSGKKKYKKGKKGKKHGNMMFFDRGTSSDKGHKHKGCSSSSSDSSSDSGKEGRATHDDIDAKRSLLEGLSVEELAAYPDVQRAFDEMQANGGGL